MSVTKELESATRAILNATKAIEDYQIYPRDFWALLAQRGVQWCESSNIHYADTNTANEKYEATLVGVTVETGSWP